MSRPATRHVSGAAGKDSPAYLSFHEYQEIEKRDHEDKSTIKMWFEWLGICLPFRSPIFDGQLEGLEDGVQ